MDTIINTIRGVITLDEQFYEQFLVTKNVMKRGFLIMIACLFIAFFPTFGQNLITNMRPFTAETAAEFTDEFTGVFELFQPADMDDEALRQIQENMAFGMQIAADIDALPTPLPRPIAAFNRALGSWVTDAFSRVGFWLGYGALVLLIAKLLGGRGVLNSFYGLTALFAVPGLLGLFSFIPFLGPVFTIAGLVWGILVYLRAVQISQDISFGQSLLATFLPILILFVIGACFSTVALAAFVNAISSAQF